MDKVTHSLLIDKKILNSRSLTISPFLHPSLIAIYTPAMETDRKQQETTELGVVPSSDKTAQIAPANQRLDRNFSLLSICSVGIVTGST